MDTGSLQLVGPNFREVIEHYEQGPGGGVALKVYLDSRGFATVGWGHRVLPGEDFSAGITPYQAEDIFTADASRIGLNLATLLVRQPSQQQWDALFALAYNAGWEALVGTHTLAYFNAGNDAACANEFLDWNHSGGKVLAGLTFRCHTESHLYLTGEVIFYNV